MTQKAIRSALLAALVSMVFVAAAAAHVEFISSSPPAGANLSSAPSEVTITFDDELDPDLSSFTVTGPGAVEVGAGEVDLSVADRNLMTGPVTVTVPGVYTVAWSVAGVDGHGLEGTFSFGYQATGPIPDPTGDESPDTAMPVAVRGWGVALLGALGVAVAAAIIIRRMEAH